MFDFSFELPAIILLVIILASYFSEHRLPVEHSYMYVTAIAISFAATFFNFASAYVDADVLSYPFPLILFLNSGFYILDILRFFVFLEYFMVNSSLRTNISARIVSLVGLAAAEVLTVGGMVSGDFYIIDETGYYITSGYIFIDVVIFIVCFFEVLIVLISMRETLDHRARLYFGGAVAVQTFIGVIDLFFPYLLMSDILSAIVFLLFYMAVENPSLYRSTNANSFNFDGMEMMFKGGQFANHRAFGIDLMNYMSLRNIYLPSVVRRAVQQAGEFLMGLPDTYPFYVGDGQFVVLCGKKSPDLRKEFSQRCEKPFTVNRLDLYFNAGYAEVAPDPGCIPTDMDLFQTNIKAVLCETEKNETLLIDQRRVDAFHRKTLVHHILNEKVAAGDVRMFLQPIMDAKTGQLVGAEALARLYDEKEGWIFPNDFIPIAEETGLIEGMGRQMLEKACAFLQKQQVPGLQWVNVNVSPGQFVNLNLSKEFAGIVEGSGISMNSIHLEITEEAYIADASLQDKIDAFRKNQFQIVLDDFGSGYSSLSRVISNPFSNIKLDISFVRSSLEGEQNILPEMVQAFHKIGFTVTAEGVETADMVDRLRDYGCDFLQGYYYSKPLPVDEFVRKYGT